MSGKGLVILYTNGKYNREYHVPSGPLVKAIRDSYKDCVAMKHMKGNVLRCNNGSMEAILEDAKQEGYGLKEIGRHKFGFGIDYDPELVSKHIKEYESITKTEFGEGCVPRMTESRRKVLSR